MDEKKSQNSQPMTQKSNTVSRRRIFILMSFFGAISFFLLGVKLWDIQVTNHDFYKEQAFERHTRDIEVSANRGRILDAEGNTLALSATVHHIVLSPKDIIEEEYDQQLIASGLSALLGISEADIYDSMAKTDRQYEVIARDVEQDLSEEVRTFISDNELSRGVYLEASSKRFYPYSNLAAQVVGFVNAENEGAYGLEALYEEELSAEIGRIVTSRAGNGLEMISSYESYVDAQNGSNIHLTIDPTIQAYAERVLEEGTLRYAAQRGGFCIVMDPDTGALYALASSPSYDLNAPSDIVDPLRAQWLAELEAEIQQLQDLQIKQSTIEQYVATTSVAALDPSVTPIAPVLDPAGNIATDALTAMRESLTPGLLADIDAFAAQLGGQSISSAGYGEMAAQKEAEYDSTVTTNRFDQWRNKAINESYEPGSTFKPITVAAALEEGLVKETDTFLCTGSVMVEGWGAPIYCSNRSGHGVQTLREAMMNSCNPAMIEIQERMGGETFYDYIGEFGLKDSTGIDLLGEGNSAFWPTEQYITDPVSQAVSSFGQRFQVTPINMVTALSAVINGGHLMEPYVVQSMTDAEGNVLEYREPTEVREVISEQTSAQLRTMLQAVVDGGTGKNARVSGYTIGGKTGSSETIETDENGRIIVSFLGFAPVDDPEIVVLLGFDFPTPAAPGQNYTGYGDYISGGSMAAPLAGELIADILDYMEIGKNDENVIPDVSVPNLVGEELAEAEETLKGVGLGYRIVGTGAVVTDQTPTVGISIPSGSEVVLYLDQPKDAQKVSVPDVTGLTHAQTQTVLESLGIYLKSDGLAVGTALVAFTQSIEPGTMVDPGTVVEVSFKDNTIRDYGSYED